MNGFTQKYDEVVASLLPPGNDPDTCWFSGQRERWLRIGVEGQTQVHRFGAEGAKEPIQVTLAWPRKQAWAPWKLQSRPWSVLGKESSASMKGSEGGKAGQGSGI